MKASVKLEGLDALAKVYSAAQKPPAYLARAITSEARVVLNESKKIVPVKLGTLRSSGTVEKPVITPTRASVTVSYGGSSAPYALIVHEVPPNTGGRWGTGYNHKPGKSFKYLEIPANAHREKFLRGVKQRLIGYLMENRKGAKK
jgi:hypothetical protein